MDDYPLSLPAHWEEYRSVALLFFLDCIRALIAVCAMGGWLALCLLFHDPDKTTEVRNARPTRRRTHALPQRRPRFRKRA